MPFHVSVSKGHKAMSMHAGRAKQVSRACEVIDMIAFGWAQPAALTPIECI